MMYTYIDYFRGFSDLRPIRLRNYSHVVVESFLDIHTPLAKNKKMME